MASLCSVPVNAHRKTSKLGRYATAVAVSATFAAASIMPAAAADTGVRAERSQDCPNAAAPPAPVDTSEVPKPGTTTPAPLEVPANPVGGEQMAGCAMITPEGTPEAPEVNSDTWVIADLDSGAVLAAKNPHGRQRPASTMKLLTGLLVTRELKMDDTLVATQEDANQEGTRVGLVPNVTYTVRQVLTGLFLHSGNDCAHALAMKMGGVEPTLTKMNALAHEIGALDTRAATPSGLDGPGMSASAFDLATIFRAGMHNPDYAATMRTPNAEIPGAPGQPPIPLVSDNQVVLHYPGAIGGKTGFTDDARHTFVGAAERNGRRLVVTLMHGENTPQRQSAQAMKLLDYGFSLGGSKSVGSLNPPSAQVPPGKVSPPSPRGPAAPEQTSLLGSVGGPLALVSAVGVVLLAVIGLRQRRAKLAAASRRDSGGSDTHP